MNSGVVLDRPLDIAAISQIARDYAPLSLSAAAKDRILSARRRVESLVSSGKPAYGVTTGVGDFCTRSIAPADMGTLSNRIILSHACGVGQPLPDERVRAVIACAINNYAHGFSGIRELVVTTLAEMLNRDVTPVVPAKGSVGYIIYMAHIAAAMLGYGRAKFNGEVLPAADALYRAGLQTISLEAKEGISLVNGTPGATGLAALAIVDGERLAKWADAISALSFEALSGSLPALDARIHELRPHQGQGQVASNLRRYLQGTDEESSRTQLRIQDALSLRAIPQVHGAARDQLRNARQIVETELRSVTDNPLVFDTDEGPEAVSGCNAHGQPLSFAMDMLATGVSALGNIAERRTFRLLTPAASNLPAFLAKDGGLNTGLMIPQYVSASLVAENKVLCHPMSVDTILTSALQEDHLSFATPSALKTGTIIENVEHILAIELLTAAQANEMLPKGRRMGLGTRALYELVRERIPPMDEDRYLEEDIIAVKDLLRSSDALSVLESECGLL